MPVFTNVGQLKAILENMADNEVIWSQVVAEDGSAWSTSASLDVTNSGLKVLTLSHKDLKTLLDKKNAT